MKTFMLCTALLLLACTPVRAADKREQTFVLGADVNAQGEVTQTQPEASVTKPIAAVLDLALKHWRFVPAQQNGKAVPAHTFVEVKLEATPDDAGKYSLRVSYVRHGPTWDRRLAPRYPLDALRNYAAGLVVVRGSLQSDGKIVITDTRTALSGNGESLLRKATTDWFLQHKSMPETVDGSPVPAQIRVYITFRLNAVGSGREKPAGEELYSARERELLHQAGFKDSEIDAKFGAPVISTVLQASMTNPVIIHL